MNLVDDLISVSKHEIMFCIFSHGSLINCSGFFSRYLIKYVFCQCIMYIVAQLIYLPYLGYINHFIFNTCLILWWIERISHSTYAVVNCIWGGRVDWACVEIQDCGNRVQTKVLMENIRNMLAIHVIKGFSNNSSYNSGLI